VASPRSRVPTTKKVRVVRDSSGRVSEYRIFEPNAVLGNHCIIRKIKRAPGTNQIVGIFTTHGRVTQDDLDSTS